MADGRTLGFQMDGHLPRPVSHGYTSGRGDLTRLLPSTVSACSGLKSAFLSTHPERRPTAKCSPRAGANMVGFWRVLVKYPSRSRHSANPSTSTKIWLETYQTN